MRRWSPARFQEELEHILQETRRWPAQAGCDLDAAALNAREGFAALACFPAQPLEDER